MKALTLAVALLTASSALAQDDEEPPRVLHAVQDRLVVWSSLWPHRPDARIRIDDMACAAVSFPGFSETLRAISSRQRGAGPRTPQSPTRAPARARASFSAA